MKKIFVSLMVVLMVVFSMAPSFAENIPEGNEPVVTNDADVEDEDADVEDEDADVEDEDADVEDEDAVVEDEDAVDNPKTDVQDDSAVKAEPQKETKAQASTKSIKKVPKEAGATVEIDSPTADKINDAITASTGAVSIVLNDDVTLDKQIVVPSGKVITIKGKSGQNITVKGTAALFTASLYMMNVAEGGSLTLGDNMTLDATSTASASLFVKSQGALTIDGCNMKKASVNQWYNGAIYITGAKATLIMNSGTISDCTISDMIAGVIHINKKATATLAGGTLENNTITQHWVGTVFIDDATFKMSGGEIKNNSIQDVSKAMTSTPGVFVGGVYEKDATAETARNSYFTMTGGTISGNKGCRGGGVIVKGGDYGFGDLYSKAYFTMDGGTITGNSADGFSMTSDPYFMNGGGGGVYVEYGGEFTMNGGNITKNSTVGNGGGVATFDGFVGDPLKKVQYSVYDGYIQHGRDLGKWPEFFPAKFTMNGGNISNNEAKLNPLDSNGMGGGVYIASAKNEINKGTIENNKAGNQGGGVYVGSVPYSVSIYNALITENNANVIGGGVWICPTGDVQAFIHQGAAFYDNEAKDAADEIAVVKNNNHHSVVISDRMLGGGSANWYQDGAIDSSVLGNADSSMPRYDPNGTSNTKVTIPDYSDAGYALKATPNKASKDLAVSKAKVYIRGNTAERGAGIGSNGSIYTGKEQKEPVEATVTKVWNTDKTEDKSVPGSVKVWLTIDGYKVESVELSKDNNWTHTFKGLPNDVKVTFTEEKVEGFTTTYSEMKQNAQTGNWEGTITNTKNEIPSYDPPVKKSIVGNAAPGDEYSFTLKATNANTPMPEGSKDGVKTISIKGAGNKEFGDIFYNKEGTYIYSIEEVKGSIKNCDYDKTEYKLTVTVNKNAAGGALTAKGVISKPDGTAVNTCEFTNTYSDTPTTPPNDKSKKPGDKGVKTGDDSNIALWAVLAALGLVGIVGTFALKRRKR